MVARRESRSVLPKTLPKPVDAPPDATPAVVRDRPRRSSRDRLGRSRPYSARNVSSSDGSRLTKSTSSYFAASRTTGAIEPATRSRSRWSSVDTSLTPVERRERRHRHLAGEAQLDLVVGEVAQRLDPVDLDQPALADDRDAVAGLLDLAEDVARQEDRPALGLGLADDLVEGLLDERVEAGGRLVEDQQVGPMLERDDQPDLLLVALRVLLELAARVDVEAARSGRAGRPGRPRRAGSRSTRSSGRRSACRTARTRRAGSRRDGGSRPGRRSSRCRRRTPARTSAGCGRAASGSSSSCRRRWVRGSRTPRPARSRGRRR